MKFRICLATAFLSSFLGAQEPTAPPPAGAPPAGAHHMNMDPNKPASEAFKNIQILKDVPAGQFMQTMRTFTASLGVKCSFCHVEGNFSADDKEEKKTARTMLTMVGTINHQFFGGEMEVQCYTCHRGASRPVSKAPESGAPGGPGGPGGPPPANQ